MAHRSPTSSIPLRRAPARAPLAGPARGLLPLGSTPLALSAVALAASLLAAPARAQTAPAASAQLAPVVVTGRSDPAVGIGGWGELPLSRLPLQASATSAEQMRDNGVQRLSDLTAFDPALSDAYNTEGYWDYLTVRGFVLDNRFNFRRDGLPISAETSIPLDNKARVEVLKGASGIQAGTSAPGGLSTMQTASATCSPWPATGAWAATR
jgi:iron complex outermembrane receptor protein